MRAFLPAVVGLTIFGCASLWAQSVQTDTGISSQESVDQGAAMREAMRLAHEQAKSPEELIALKAEILDRYPQPAPQALPPMEPMPARPPEHLDAAGALAYEMSQVLNEIAREAKSPEELIAAKDEFFRLNVEAFEWLRTVAVSFPAEENRIPPADRTKLPAATQIALALSDVRAQATTPEEQIAAVDEFLRMNRAAIETTYDSTQPASHEKAPTHP